ncbi:CPBP family intramembrane metalloprotease [Mangrovimicrobium sediminis]|uniref:CPBP family intramembrane metalloprotease n=1 Tax=Mangrovimicrobium sediminis TaxID=2562682 RepID=A0A4Z0MA13_9GAMM|nr:type II CAAX endopeptidase family protein [Haliea sp. SAOS-164]TGD76240.1 CPBP family intramembrane metalloprotease [Haliea sp. SAOS-164]
MMNSTLRFPTVFIFLVIVLYPLGIWLLLRYQGASPLMLTVGLAAISACLLCRRNPGTLGWHWGNWKYHYQSYLVPLLYATIAYIGIWVLDFGGWYAVGFVDELRQDYMLESWSDTSLIALHFVLTGTVSFVLLLPGVLGEEIGWRGLLVPALSARFRFTTVALLSGLLWSMWHWPLMFLGFYGNSETPLVFQLASFTLCLVSISIVMAYFRYKSDSLWPAVTLHMSHNVFLQKFFSPMTEATEATVWYADEFGIALPLVAACFGAYYWRKGVREFDAVEEQQHTEAGA